MGYIVDCKKHNKQQIIDWFFKIFLSVACLKRGQIQSVLRKFQKQNFQITFEFFLPVKWFLRVQDSETYQPKLYFLYDCCPYETPEEIGKKIINCSNFLTWHCFLNIFHEFCRTVLHFFSRIDIFSNVLGAKRP